MRKAETQEPLATLTSGLNITFDPSALHTFDSHRQLRCYKRESRGQLFAKVRGENWKILCATGPRANDVRGRFRFWPNRESEQAEIFEHYEEGLEYVGEWHTHPQDRPSPSASDIKSVNNIVRELTHHFPGFLLCIVGRCPFPEGLWISFHTIDGSWSEIKISS